MLEMQVLKTYPRSTESDILGVGQSSLWLKSAWWFWCPLKFENWRVCHGHPAKEHQKKFFFIIRINFLYVCRPFFLIKVVWFLHLFVLLYRPKNQTWFKTSVSWIMMTNCHNITVSGKCGMVVSVMLWELTQEKQLRGVSEKDKQRCRHHLCAFS